MNSGTEVKKIVITPNLLKEAALQRQEKDKHECEKEREGQREWGTVQKKKKVGQGRRDKQSSSKEQNKKGSTKEVHKTDESGSERRERDLHKVRGNANHASSKAPPGIRDKTNSHTIETELTNFDTEILKALKINWLVYK